MGRSTEIRRLIVTFAALAALSFLTPSAAGLDERRVQNLEQYLTALNSNRGFNGNVLVAERGKVVFRRSFGYSDFAEHRLNKSGVSFPIASVSKLLTATAILQLVEQQRIQLSDPATKYLPGFPYPGITIRHLLSHTSGLPPYNRYFDPLWKKSPDRVFTNVDFLRIVNADPEPLLYEPGTKGNYDNVNYIVLALVLERVSGENYSNYIETHILRPAGMKATKFIPLSYQYTKLRSRDFAFPHIYPHLYSDTPILANKVPYVVSYWGAYAFTGFADYVSTTDDLLKLDQAYYSGRLLSKGIQDLAFTPVKLMDGSDNPGLFGLGWEIEKDQSAGKIVYHSGAATGLSCVLLRNLDKNQTIVVFDNAHSNAHQIGDDVLNILNGQHVSRPRKSIAKVYVQTLLTTGPDAARSTLDTLRAKTSEYELDEDQINSLGYDLMGSENTFHLPQEDHLKEALEVFKINTELFPVSWNAYDSYGEALRKAGRTAESIRMYERSLRLNPANKSASKALSEMVGIEKSHDTERQISIP